MGSGVRPGVADLLAEAAGRARHRPALVSPEGSWSYDELSAEVDVRAGALARDGVGPGRLEPLTLEADAAGILTLLAAWRLGATVAPLHPGLTAAERRQAAATLEGTAPGAQAVLWTSGTSGRPRGVALSADNLRVSALATQARLGLGPEDVWLASLSLAHVGGLALVTRSLLLGATLVAWGRFHAGSASELMDGVAIRDGAPPRLTHMSVVPTQLLQLLEQRRGAPPPPTFRCALVGGAHAPAGLVGRALDEGWPLALTYGMTEMTSQVATAPPARFRAKPGTVGAPLDGAEVRVAPDGEILTRGATLALGYLGTDVPLRDVEGWYHTGDLGWTDGDGDLWITGRRADRIVSGGVNVDAHEVGAALRAPPAVRDACVVGVPDERWGESVAAALVPTGDGVDLDALADWLRERLSPAKRPRLWKTMEALPLNANGKVDRGAVRRGMLEG